MTTEYTPMEPTVSKNARGEQIIDHPAFGMVSVNRIHSTGTTLFASDLRHAEIIELEIYEGRMVEHDGVQRPAREQRRPIVSISLSAAQWASLVCSFGLGEGVPCTLTRKPESPGKRVAPIKHIESTRQRFDRNIEESAERQLLHLQNDLDSLRGMLTKGKAGKRELEELVRSMSAHLTNLPKNLSFSTQLIKESMDSIVSAGKAELEASAVGVAMRLGVKEISRLVELESKTND